MLINRKIKRVVIEKVTYRHANLVQKLDVSTILIHLLYRKPSLFMIILYPFFGVVPSVTSHKIFLS